MNLKRPTLTQLILIALVFTQVPTFWEKVNRYDSFYHARTACTLWEGQRKDRDCFGQFDGPDLVVTGVQRDDDRDGYNVPVKAFHY